MLLAQEFLEVSQEIPQRGGDDLSRPRGSTTKLTQIPEKLVGGAGFPASRLAMTTTIQEKSAELLVIQHHQRKPTTF